MKEWKNKDFDKGKQILRTIIDSLPITVNVLDQKGRKVLSNKADYELTGACVESEVLGKSDLELFPDRVGERRHKDNMDIINGNLPIISREEDFPDRYNNQRWLLTSKLPLFDSNNQIKGLIGLGIDITELKNLQKKISESETFYRKLVDISPNGVLIADLDGKITFVSKRVFQIFGIPEGDDLIGEPVFKWIAPESLSMSIINFTDLIERNRDRQTVEYLCLKHDFKTEFWLESSATFLLDAEGRTTGVMIVCRDISYRKKIEVELISAKNKAEENDRLKTAFLHNISHEIRTPLNAIIGFSSLLGDPMITRDQQQSFFEIIKKSSDHLLSIISDIVEISNIDADIITVNENDVDLNDIIKDLFDQYLPLCEKKNIQLMYSFGVRDEKVIIRSDKTKLVQILSNLLSNSLRFTDTGIISFGYYVEQNTLRFCVSDTGKGVPEDECHKIFDRFYQIKPSEERIYEGTGLGLSICKAYVELLGGHIGVTSTVGKGSVFHFSIPFKRVKAPSRINENIDMKGPGRFPG